MKLTVVGCGYVGLVTGVGLASRGHVVTGIDASHERVDAINGGRVPFFEPGLEEALSQAILLGKYHACVDFHAVRDADLVMLCVGTPSATDGCIDLSMLRAATHSVAQELKSASHCPMVVVRSTVIPGTTESVILPILEQVTKFRGALAELAVNPEFLREGQALEDFFSPDRIVIGQLNTRSGDRLEELYQGFDAPVIRTNPATAEMIKYSANALLATLVSFSNELARICERIRGVDVEEVLSAVRQDRRLTVMTNGLRIQAGINHYLKAGCGYGGSCLPKDLRALIEFGREIGIEPHLLQAVHAVNDSQPSHFVDLAQTSVDTLEGKRVLVLGLGFKAGTDDIRESPGILIASNLLQRGAIVTVADPLVRRDQVSELISAGAEYSEDPTLSFQNSEVCFITTSAPEFEFVEGTLKNPPHRAPGPLIVDGRRILASQPTASRERYIGIGLGSSG